MKKGCFLFIFPLLVAFCINAPAQSWLWEREGYGDMKANFYASPVATDKNGNAYITGQYSPIIIFGSDTLTDNVDNAYLTKYNSTGGVQWARQIINTGAGLSYGNSVATDKWGNVYIAGWFSGTAQAGAYTLTGPNSYNIFDVFLIKYNTGGTVLWAKQSTLPANSKYSSGYGSSVATDKFGNVFIAGYFVDSVSFGGHTLSTMRDTNRTVSTFLIKYDSSGNVLWAKQSGAPSINSLGYGMAVTTDNTGNAYFTGYFADTITFGATTLFCEGGEGFIAKYSSAGTVLWAKQSVSDRPVQYGGYCRGYAITIDRANNPYITGAFSDSINFGPYTVFSRSSYQAFLAKYDTNGNPLWARQSLLSWWQGSGLASDASNHIYLTGVATFNQSPYTLQFDNYKLYTNPQAATSSFLMKFDTSGHPVCGYILNNLGSPSPGYLNGVASDSSGNYIYTAGIFGDTLFCGPDTLLPQGSNDIFLGRWLGCSDDSVNGIPGIKTNNTLMVYPNPSNGLFTIQSSVVSNKSVVEVYNILGEKVYSAYYPLSTNIYSLDLSGKPKGMYFVRVIDVNNNLIGTDKIVVQ